MAKHQEIEQLRQLIMEYGLPLTDMALFGIRCPYCGKSDRVRALESPEEIAGGLPEDALAIYRVTWQSLISEDSDLGVCKFCQNLLRLPEGSQAESLFD